jgi:hypothetical protein
MNLEKTISALHRVGQVFGNENSIDLQQTIAQAYAKNKWFDEDNTKMALSYWSKQLTTENLNRWVSEEGISNNSAPKTIGVIAAGNIPLVGLHDVISVLLTGNKVKVKLSSDDEVLMKFFIAQLIQAEPSLGQLIEVAEKIENIDAVIATGSNNTARYFEYYFNKYPHIIRKNRNSIAVLTGNESAETIQKIGGDILSYFGKGCRNITQLWLPKKYDLVPFLDHLQGFVDVVNHNKYANNYHYHKAILLMNKDEHLDTGFMLLREDKKIYSPIGMINYTYYNDMGEVKEFLAQNAEHIQCVVSEADSLPEAISAGETQNPKLWDYADGVNTISFLQKL